MKARIMAQEKIRLRILPGEEAWNSGGISGVGSFAMVSPQKRIRLILTYSIKKYIHIYYSIGRGESQFVRKPVGKQLWTFRENPV